MCRKMILLILVAISIPLMSMDATSNGKEKLSEMSEEDCLSFIISCGVTIPEELKNNEELGSFVKSIIKKIEDDPDHPFGISYTVTVDFIEKVREVVKNY